MNLTELAYLRDEETRCRRLAGTGGQPEFVATMRKTADEYARRVAEVLRVGTGNQAVLMQMPRHQGSPPVKKAAAASK